MSKNYIYFDPRAGWSPSTSLMACISGCLASGPPAARRTRGPCGAPVRRLSPCRPRVCVGDGDTVPSWRLSPYARLGPCVRGDVRDRLGALRWRPRPRVRGERRLRSRLGGVPQPARLQARETRHLCTVVAAYRRQPAAVDRIGERCACSVPVLTTSPGASLSPSVSSGVSGVLGMPAPLRTCRRHITIMRQEDLSCHYRLQERYTR